MSIFSQDWDTATLVLNLPSRAVIAQHVHDENQLVYASAGVIAVTTDAGSWIAPANRAIWIPAGAAHQHRVYGLTKLHGVGLTADHNPLGLTSPAVVAVNSLLRELIIHHTERAGHEASGLRRERLMGVLVDELAISPEQPIRLPVPRDARLVAVSQLVEADLARSIDLTELARLSGSSPRTLARLFRDEMGMSYVQWRTQLRLYHALRMLADGLAVTTVARRCGWRSVSTFVDVFRRTFGHTPGGRQQALSD